jgi:glycosyltransferase involved in cell wall biosynthesis
MKQLKSKSNKNSRIQKRFLPTLLSAPEAPVAVAVAVAPVAPAPAPAPVAETETETETETPNNPSTLDRVKIPPNPTKQFVNQLMRDRPDIDPQYLYKCLIDHSKYIEKYKDVAESGMHAAEHYFTFGHSESRELKRPGILEQTQKFKIASNTTLFVSCAEIRDGSFIYRCLFQSAQYKNNLVYSGNTQILKLVRAVFNCKEMIYSRPEKNETAFYLIELAKNIGVKVTLDYDDLLLPEHAEFLGSVRSVDGTTIEASRKNLINKSSFLLYADSFRCSTPEIAKAISSLEKPIEIVKNKILKSMVADENKCKARLKNIENRKIRILYLSGTATHKKDYSIAQGAIIKLAQEYPDKFELTFLGNTGGNTSPISLYNKSVTVIPRVSINEMYKVISEHDVALVPLENTIFNRAKSNIKFIECGSQGVPIIASPLNEFKDVVIHGENGWLCESQTDWYNQLKLLINNPAQLHKTSLAARTCVLNNFTLEG